MKKIKYLKINITKEHIGSLVHIHDTRFSDYNGLYIITSLSGTFNDDPVVTKRYPELVRGYRLSLKGKWGHDIESGSPKLGITAIYTKETHPEYYL